MGSQRPGFLISAQLIHESEIPCACLSSLGSNFSIWTMDFREIICQFPVYIRHSCICCSFSICYKWQNLTVGKELVTHRLSVGMGDDRELVGLVVKGRG